MVYVDKWADLRIQHLIRESWKKLETELAKSTTVGLVFSMFLRSARQGLYIRSVSWVYGPQAIHIVKGESLTFGSTLESVIPSEDKDGIKQGNW